MEATQDRGNHSMGIHLYYVVYEIQVLFVFSIAILRSSGAQFVCSWVLTRKFIVIELVYRRLRSAKNDLWLKRPVDSRATSVSLSVYALSLLETRVLAATGETEPGVLRRFSAVQHGADHRARD